MQTSSAIRTRPRAAVASPAREISWSFMLLVIVCACVVAAGFFFAARQHFTSMDYGIKNSKLREQLENLEAEKRRLLLAREVAVSPHAVRKAARAIGLREASEIEAVQVAAAPKAENVIPSAEPVKAFAAKPAAAQTFVNASLSAPVPPKSSGETRSRVVDTSKDKKTEVAALLKLK